jgi:hypothetical protein
VEDVGRLNGRGRGLMPLVTRASPRPVDGLLHGIHREYPETDRQRVTHGNLGQASSRLPRDVVEVRGLAPDDRTQRDEAGIAP